MAHKRYYSALLGIAFDESTDLETSTDEENEVEETNLIYIHYSKCRSMEYSRVRVPVLNNYVEKIIPNYSRRVFKEQFRMYPETFELVLSEIGHYLQGTRICGRQPLTALKQLLIAIWFMSTPDSYRLVCVKFGVGRATVFRALGRVTYSLHCIAPRIIKWPSENAHEVMASFESKCGFPKIIGAIDGTHIKIRKHAQSYINRRGFPSIQLQVVCDSKGIFTHCFAGHVGSVHDARVLRNSPIANILNDAEDIYFPSHSISNCRFGLSYSFTFVGSI